MKVDSREGSDTWNTSMKWININEKFIVKYILFDSVEINSNAECKMEEEGSR